MMLNLFEFMEHDEKPLPIDVHKLAPTWVTAAAPPRSI